MISLSPIISIGEWVELRLKLLKFTQVLGLFHGHLCSTPFRPDPIGGSEPNLGCSDTILSAATPEPGPTRLADPDRIPSDARLILFIYFFYLNFLFQKCRDPNP